MPPSRVPGAPAVPPTGSRPPLVALLLVGSGFCALVYEVAWLRMLRLVFGVSTAASAAVLAIFLGGLGLGGLLLGRRADRARSPLRLYADLETGVAVAAAATPLLLAVVARLYVLLGGTAVLGLAVRPYSASRSRSSSLGSRLSSWGARCRRPCAPWSAAPTRAGAARGSSTARTRSARS